MNLKKMSVWLFAACVLPLSAEVKSYFIEMKHGDEQAKKAYFDQKVRIWGGSGYKTSPENYTGLLVLANKKITFAFHLQGKQQSGEAVNVNIGMIAPQALNWYAGGFINIFFGNTLLKSGAFSVKEIKSSPKSGYAELEYKGKNVSGIIRLELAENDNKLQLTFKPGNTTQSYTVVCLAYPGEYGKAELRKRILTTPKGVFAEKEKTLTKEEYWGIFSDSYYDRSLKRGRGCCAFLYNPKEVSSAMVKLGYGCTINLQYPAGRSAHMILWDFNWAQATALNYMNTLNLSFE